MRNLRRYAKMRRMTQTQAMEQLVGTRRAATLLKKSRATVARWAKTGRLTPVPTDSGGLLFRLESVLDLKAHLDAIAPKEVES